MAQVRTLDGNILSWVKSEIDTTMGQARQALETHVETPDDASQLQFCLNYLHQVYGTLQMVELYGASMLSEEMERLVQAIIDKKVTNRNDAYEVLMRGMMQLPDYLEKLQSGQPDYPIVLLPLLNDLRAARNAGLLTESALFSPNLDVDAPIPLERAEQPIDTLARKLRHAYHLGLLNVIRDSDTKAGLKKLAAVIEKLRQSANDPDASRMLWAASGVVEALRDHGIDTSIAVKLLLGQVDRHVKKIIDKGEFALSNEPPHDLLKNLLYYVASSNSAGKRVKEIKDAFHLANVMPDKETLLRARADLSAPNAALMRTVSKVMLDDLTQIKDTLDVFMRSSERDKAILATMGDKLAQMADTLGMLGYGDQRHILLDQITALREMAAGKRDIAENTLMDVAGALLGIEEVLGQPAARPVAEQKARSDESLVRTFQEPEQRKLVKRVVDEAKVDLSVIKDAFNEYGRTPKQIQLLKDVPGLLDRIRGSLSILSLDRAASILKAAATFIQRNILGGNNRPEPRTLELLADSISSVEYYLESLVDSWGHPTSILDVAEQSLADLGISKLDAGKDGSIQPVTGKQPSPDEQTLVDIPMPDMGGEDQDATMQLTVPDLPGGDMRSAATAIAEDTTEINIEGFDELDQIGDTSASGSHLPAIEIEEPEVEGSISQEFNLPMPDQKAAPAAPPAARPAAPIVAATAKSTIADELDEEIVDIFLEEANEEHANISRLLPAWYNNQESDTALKELRRSFHTLKGSGRLVGAADVGEFAWAFENMLNRVIDHTVAPSPEMFELLDKARHKLPQLLKLFREGGKPEQDVFNLMAQADAISHGKPVAEIQIKKTAEVAVSPAVAKPASPPAAIPAAAEELPPAPAANEPVADLQLEMPNDSLLPVEEEIDIPSISLELEEFPASVEAPLELAPAPGFELPDEMLENTEIISLPAPSIDPVLLDIYRKEIDAHLVNVREYINDWQSGKDNSANQKLVRAIHTIKGSSRTANVEGIAELCGVIEDHLRVLQDDNRMVGEELITLLSDTDHYIETTVTMLDIPGAILPDNSELLQRARGLEVAAAAASVVTPVEIDLDLDLDEQPTVTAVIQKPIMAPAAEEAGADLERTPDYDTELLEIFLEEGVDILNDSDQTLHAWSTDLDNKDHVRALQRQLHTLKGGARMAGVTEIGDLSHSIENMLTAIAEHDLPVNPQMLHVLQKAQDRLVNMLELVRRNLVPKAAVALIDALDTLATGNLIDESVLAEPVSTPVAEEIIPVDIPLSESEDLTLSSEPAVVEEILPADVHAAASGQLTYAENIVPLTPELPTAPAVPEEVPAEVPQAAEQTALQRVRGEQVRVRADLLDNLVNFAGEVSIYRSRMEQHNNAFRHNIKELDDTVRRLREQLRKFEIETETQIQFRYEEAGATHAGFDPLEMDRFTQMQTLSRGMLESLNDLDSLRGILNNLTRESETLLLQQSRVNTELQEGLMRTRMVPFAGQVPRMRRIVRQAADESGKHADLQIHGAENELDRTVLERVMSPIEHMLRNAIAHGIESPEAREAAGKPATGQVRMSFTREAADLVITITDDGAGINLDAIRKKAIERGMIKPDAVVTKQDLIDMILESGFSTAQQVTQLAGRGVGMDVVNNEVKQLGGHLEINTEPGAGTTFRISMPISLSVSRALMVTVAENVYAIPLIGVETVERVPREEIVRLQSDKSATYKWLEHDYRYIHLSSTLGLTELHLPLEEQRRIPLLLIRSGEYRAAIQVDGLIGSREIVVKPVGPQLSTLRGITGATIMGDGSVVLILDLGLLVRATAVEHVPVAEEMPLEAVVVQEVPEKRIPLVMVVDDSITVRKVTTRFLERNNFRSISAKDGVDALTQLQEHRPDIMLLDVEMPRMDGFELATNIRNDASLQNLPIIMITSRTGQKHRDRAMEIGVNIYMGKPYSEAELLDNINKLLSV